MAKETPIQTTLPAPALLVIARHAKGNSDPNVFSGMPKQTRLCDFEMAKFSLLRFAGKKRLLEESLGKPHNDAAPWR